MDRTVSRRWHHFPGLLRSSLLCLRRAFVVVECLSSVWVKVKTLVIQSAEFFLEIRSCGLYIKGVIIIFRSSCTVHFLNNEWICDILIKTIDIVSINQMAVSLALCLMSNTSDGICLIDLRKFTGLLCRFVTLWILSKVTIKIKLGHVNASLRSRFSQDQDRSR